jgi:flagellar M-ring protein FliF
MAAVTAVLIGFFAFLILRVTAPAMVPLFTELAMEDSASVVKELERQTIPYELKNDGATVLVPKDRVTRLRMKLAESGLPKGGGIGYEIFDKSDALGATSFVQNVNHLRALEGELARTIRSIDRVQTARVHLVLPERPLFARDRNDPSASIVLRVRGTLEAQQVRAIRHLVASAVNGLKPQRISIVDEAGRLLADGAMVDDATGSNGVTADERQAVFEKRMREQVEAIISSVVGPGRARVQLTADFDHNRVTQTFDRYDPDSRVVRSSQTREESLTGADRDGQVTVGNELPGANQRATETTTVTRDQNRKSEEIVNYEISRTTKTEVTEGGRVNRISVAVLVDGSYSRNDKNEVVYTPRAAEEIDRIAALVRTAIGFDQKRGDQVEVVNLRFAQATVPLAPEAAGGVASYLHFTKDDIMQGIEMLVMALLGITVLLLIVRPLIKRMFPARRPQSAEAIMATALAEGDVQAAIAAGATAEEITAAQAVTNQTAKMIDIAQVQGQVHAQSVQKVGELAERNPYETVSIIRQWLADAPVANPLRALK